jgi:hypothetical protein
MYQQRLTIDGGLAFYVSVLSLSSGMSPSMRLAGSLILRDHLTHDCVQGICMDSIAQYLARFRLARYESA